MLPQLSIDPRAEGIRVLPLDPAFPTRRHVLAWNRDRRQPHADQRIVELIAEIGVPPASVDRGLVQD